MTTPALHALPTASPVLPGGATLSESAMHEAGNGFAAALDDAKAALDELETAVADPAAAAMATAAPVASAAPALLSPTPEVTAPPIGDALANALGEALATPATAAAPTPGWPPPGLSSLFPEGALFAAANAGANAVPTAGVAPSVPAAAHRAASASAAPLPPQGLGKGAALAALLNPGAETLPPDALGPTTPAAPLLAAETAKAAASVPAALPLPALASPAATPDPIALALARQPTTLRLPVAESGELEAVSALGGLAEAFAPERLPDGAAPLSTSTAPLPKLDLAQAFPGPVPLPSKHFAEDVGARLQWIAEQQGGEATLRISPEGLGPVEIRLKLDGERVELGFTASQQDTRQALQDALPKLREMLAQQGLQLGQADVGQKHAQSANDEAAKSTGGRMQDEDGDAIVLAAPTREANVIVGRSGRGMLDLYA